MKDFDDFATPSMKARAAAQVLMKRGGFHLYGPNDTKMEKEVSEQVEVVVEVLREYHKWLSQQR